MNCGFIGKKCSLNKDVSFIRFGNFFSKNVFYSYQLILIDCFVTSFDKFTIMLQLKQLNS